MHLLFWIECALDQPVTGEPQQQHPGGRARAPELVSHGRGIEVLVDG
jgi:hypothetical protein